MVTITKKTIVMAITIRGVMPSPNQATKSGTREIRGTEFNALRTGWNAVSSRFEELSRRPKAIPNEHPTT